MAQTIAPTIAQTRNFRILLIRHGLTDDNLKGIAQGHRQVPLNETGRHQARELASRLTAEHLVTDVIVSSDLSRAAETAQIIAAAINAPVVYDPQWRERGLGELEGQVVGMEGIWLAAMGEHTPPGGESLTHFVQRIHTALCALGAQHPTAATILVVAHGGPLRNILQLLHDGILPMAPGQNPPEVVNIINCSVMELQCQIHDQSQLWRLIRVNDTGHLHPVDTTANDAG